MHKIDPRSGFTICWNPEVLMEKMQTPWQTPQFPTKFPVISLRRFGDTPCVLGDHFHELFPQWPRDLWGRCLDASCCLMIVMFITHCFMVIRSDTQGPGDLKTVAVEL